MFLRKPYIGLVCLMFLALGVAGNAHAYSIVQASAPATQQGLYAPASPLQSPITKIKTKKIAKCRPLDSRYYGRSRAYSYDPRCVLPTYGSKRWELGAQVIFARTKGKVRFLRGNIAGNFQNLRDVDLNGDMGLPDHDVVPSFSARYHFKPKWSMRYQIMPMVSEGSGNSGSNFSFGSQINTFNANQDTRVKWERLYQRLGLVYDSLRTPRSRVSIFGDFVRVDDKLSFFQLGCCGDTFESDLNMAMVGLEFEKCLKTARLKNTLSLECSAGVAFLNEAFGSDIYTALKYSIPMNCGRWGYVKGGYRYLTYKKGYSDFKQWDTAIEGGFLEMGMVF
jgi:hypothetical protein